MIEQAIEMLQITVTMCKWATIIGFTASQIMLMIGLARMLLTQRPGSSYWIEFAIEAMRFTIIPAVWWVCAKVMLEGFSNGL